MDPKVFLVGLSAVTVLDDSSPTWLVLFTAMCVAVGLLHRPVYRWVLDRRKPA